MPKYLKADFHTHTAEDPKDIIRHSAFQLIDKAAELNFDILAITNHDKITYNRELSVYAEKRNILLIPGVEATLSNRHVVILNPGFSNAHLPCRLSDLPRIKTKQSVVLAPHPYFPQSCALRNDLLPMIRYFDAVEFSRFYRARMNFNKKAVLVSQQFGLPLVGTSDCHFIWELGSTYSLVESKKSCLSVLKAVKSGKLQVMTRHLSYLDIGRLFAGIAGMRFRMAMQTLVNYISDMD